MPVDPAVQEQEVLLMAARARDEANAAIQQGDIDTARHMFGEIREMLCSSPATDEVLSELKNVTGTMDLLDMGDFKSARKVSHYRSYQRKQGRGTTPKEDSPEQ